MKHPGKEQAFADMVPGATNIRFYDPKAKCHKCGCTDDDCSGCIKRTGSPCHWVEDDLCSACSGEKKPLIEKIKDKLDHHLLTATMRGPSEDDDALRKRMANRPYRVQRQRTPGWRMPPNTVYVGRPTYWGNPFIVGKDGTAAECVKKYVTHILPYSHHGKNSSMENFYKSEMNIEAMKRDLGGKNLCCWCPLDQPCHVDLLLRWANES